MKKRGQGLSLNTLVIAIIVVVVLVVVITIFLSGTSGISKSLRNIFLGVTAGTDRVTAVNICNTRCVQAESLSEDGQKSSAFCRDPFKIDDNNDGEAEKNSEGVYVDWYCSAGGKGKRGEDRAGGSGNLGISCSFSCP